MPIKIELLNHIKTHEGDNLTINLVNEMYGSIPDYALLKFYNVKAKYSVTYSKEENINAHSRYCMMTKSPGKEGITQTLGFAKQDTYEPKSILFIPPNGTFSTFDFTCMKMATEMKRLGYRTKVLVFGDVFDRFTDCFDEVHKTTDVWQFFTWLYELKRSHIMYRGWMHAYMFGAWLVKEFDNVVVTLKDWNFARFDEYCALFGDSGPYDFMGIEYIFKNAKTILSHFTQDEARLWAKEYECDVGKFVFFPELCRDKCLVERGKVKYERPFKLATAGTFTPVSAPEDYFVAKYFLRDARTVTAQGIDISFVVSEGYYDGVMRYPKIWTPVIMLDEVTKLKNITIPVHWYGGFMRDHVPCEDTLFENKFNPLYHIVKGKDMGPEVLKPYHWGLFKLSSSTKHNRLQLNAIPSKLSFYMEAGLPVLVNERLKGLSDMVRECEIGLVYKNSDIEEMDKLLDIGQERYDEICRNVETFREEFSYSKYNMEELFK